MKEIWLTIEEKVSTSILGVLTKHPGKLIGGLIGFLLGCFIIIFGFWHTLLLLLLITVGFFAGKYWDEEKRLWVWINRLFE